MAREYARIRLSIADDEDFENLSPAAQWLYLRVLLPDPSLNNAGVCDWRPSRLTVKAKGLTLAYILSAAAELEDARYVLFDTTTEEALIRSYIRVDELLRNPKMAISVVTGYRLVASKMLRAFIVTEAQKAKEEHPEYSTWTHEISKDDVGRLLTKSGSDSVQYTNQITNPISNDDPVPITNSDPGPDYQSDSVHIPSTYTSTYTPTPNTPPYPPQREPSPEQLPTKPTGSEKALARFDGIPGQPSALARQVAIAYSESGPVPIQPKLLREVAGQIDSLLQANIAPDAIVLGLDAWTTSDSFSPKQIPNYVHKANNGRRPNGVGKPTESALDYQAAAEQLLAKVSTK